MKYKILSVLALAFWVVVLGVVATIEHPQPAAAKADTNNVVRDPETGAYYFANEENKNGH